ncbi:MAG: glycoside hydrolase family 9 protein [Acidimicrobiales bacterium]
MRILRPLIALALLASSLFPVAVSAQPQTPISLPVEPLIHIDQFGYLPGSPKVAVISDPQVGFNSDDSFTPSARYEVLNWETGQSVYAGEPVEWNGGAVHQQSGDRGWWFEFTNVRDSGSYVVVDIDRGVRSHRFEIGADVYDDVLDQALRMFWFNRANAAHLEEFAGPWHDGPSFVGRRQDTEARSVHDRRNPATERDLSGGWFDAGDANKYVTFASQPVHQLLTAFERYPEVFDDAVGIPESGNGIPDVLDEVKWEIDWLAKMQSRDGGVLIKMGEVKAPADGPPSEVTVARFYEQECSSSTIAAAGMFAHAALVFRDVPELADEAAALQRRSLRAWRWFKRNPIRSDCDSQKVLFGDADWTVEQQLGEASTTAVYLHALTGKKRFRRAVRRNLKSTSAFSDNGFARYNPQQGDALLFHTQRRDAGRKTVRRIERRLRRLVGWSDTFGLDPNAGLYRSHLDDAQLHWGSTSPRANTGSVNASVAEFAIDPDNSGQYLDLASRHLQSFHGVNPLGIVYLSNMADYGAEKSVTELYHFWFADGSKFDSTVNSEIGPPPGYVPGGPNGSYSGEASPPAGQPPLKAYRDWNTNTPQTVSYEISEPGIYYQSAYVRLLASVMVNDR